MRNEIVPPFDHNHTSMTLCKVHGRWVSNGGNGKASGNTGNSGKRRMAVRAANPLGKPEQSHKDRLDESSQAKGAEVTLVMTNGKARFVR